MARDQVTASRREWWIATSMAIQRIIIERMIQTQGVHNEENVRRVYYLSLEYLMGRLWPIICSLRHPQQTQRSSRNSATLEETREEEVRHGPRQRRPRPPRRLLPRFPGHPRTPRLSATASATSSASSGRNSATATRSRTPDNWLRYGNPWEIERPESQVEVHFGGRVETHRRSRRQPVPAGSITQPSWACPTTSPSPATATTPSTTCACGRRASTEDFDLDVFNNGDYVKAYERKTLTENITKVLYPNDNIEQGKELRLMQQYFFVACSLHDIVRRFQGRQRTGITLSPTRSPSSSTTPIPPWPSPN